MDFAEKVYLPHYLQQVSSTYFLTRMKFDLFSVSNETLNEQNMYCLPEGLQHCSQHVAPRARRDMARRAGCQQERLRAC